MHSVWILIRFCSALISLNVPNPLECASWIGLTKQRLVHVITTEKRPKPLRHCLYACGRLWQLVGKDRSFNHASYARVLLDYA